MHRAKEAASLAGRSTLAAFSPAKPILIIAGGTRPEYEAQATQYEELLRAAMDGFEGTIVSGGTTCGIPGRVGAAAQTWHKTRHTGFDLVGYYPEILRKNNDLDHSNYRLFEVPTDPLDSHPINDFSAAEPLQNWIDLLASGVDPGKVQLLGVNGGNITHFEYALALALGATVGVLECSGRSASEIFLDPDWSKSPRLLPLPEDKMTLHAFVHVKSAIDDVPAPKLEAMARKVHEIYLRTAKPNYKKPATLPWEYLPEDFDFSNKAQAAYISHIAGKFGYRIQESDSGGKLPFPKDNTELDQMAEMEHGRWNVERLTRGWRHAPKKDDDLKRSPYLVPWQLVPEEIRVYDRQAVRHFQEVLAAGGFEIVRA